MRLLKRKIRHVVTNARSALDNIETVERRLDRLRTIQQETEKIFHTTRDPEKGNLVSTRDRCRESLESVREMPDGLRASWQKISEWMRERFRETPLETQPQNLHGFARDIINKVHRFSAGRNVSIQLEEERTALVSINPAVLEDTVESPLRNAMENTSDEGLIRVVIEKRNGRAWLHVEDYDTGITRENQQFVFDGLFHARETESYASKKPYAFGMGGKGMSLLKIRIYAQRHGFDVSLKSKRSRNLPSEADLRAGTVSLCQNCGTPEDCISAGGTTLSLSFNPFPGEIAESALSVPLQHQYVKPHPLRGPDATA